MHRAVTAEIDMKDDTKVKQAANGKMKRKAYEK